MQAELYGHSETIYQEMMVHPALFSHPLPKTVAIVSEHLESLVTEVLKHSTVSEIWCVGSEKNLEQTDARIKYVSDFPDKTEFFDVIIVTENTLSSQLGTFFNALHPQGILNFASVSAFQIQALAILHRQLHSTAFKDIQVLSFPQPNFPSGWRSALLGKKNGLFKKIREKDIFNKGFSTHYYNFDVHKAALVLPEFMREELTF